MYYTVLYCTSSRAAEGGASRYDCEHLTAAAAAEPHPVAVAESPIYRRDAMRRIYTHTVYGITVLGSRFAPIH